MRGSEKKGIHFMSNDNPGLIVIAWIVGILFVIIVATGITLFALKLHNDVLNPQIRKNIINDPATTIANRKDFHNKIAEIISADNNILVDLNNNVTGNDLVGVEQIRATAINAYNANAANPDLSKDMEPWMPKNIELTPLPKDIGKDSTLLNSEIDTLQTVIAKDQQGGIQ
jgi:hypothetical protein